MQPTALYRHFDAQGALLYVGISSRPISRTGEHRRKAKWFIDVVRIEIEWFGTRGDAEQAEWKAIHEEKPKHNLAHSLRAPAPIECFIVLNAQGKPVQPDHVDLSRNVHAFIEAKRKARRKRVMSREELTETTSSFPLCT